MTGIGELYILHPTRSLSYIHTTFTTLYIMSIIRTIDNAACKIVMNTMASPTFTKIVNAPIISYAVDWLLPTAVNVQEIDKNDWVEITKSTTNEKWEELFAAEISAKAENEVCDNKEKKPFFSFNEWGSSHSSAMTYIECMINNLKCKTNTHLKIVDSRSICRSIDALEDYEVKAVLEAKLIEREYQLIL